MMIASSYFETVLIDLAESVFLELISLLAKIVFFEIASE